MTEKGNRLLAQLLENPDRFKDRGQSYELLQEVFAGTPYRRYQRPPDPRRRPSFGTRASSWRPRLARL